MKQPLCIQKTDSLTSLLASRHQEVEHWLQQAFGMLKTPVYGSVDLRNAGYKIAPIDTNLYPAGFNNLSQDDEALAVKAFRHTIDCLQPNAQKILLIPENHTRNLAYFKNVRRLQQLLQQAGFDVRLGTYQNDLTDPSILPILQELGLTVSVITRQEERIGLEGFDPDLVLLNNDLSQGTPALIQNIAQPVIPHPQLGWQTRTKSQHFSYYKDIAAAFAKHFAIDPWLIDCGYSTHDNIDLSKLEDNQQLVAASQHLAHNIQQKYQQYQIEDTPFVVIKANQGTEGMAIISLQKPTEITQLNRKQRTRLSTIKGRRKVSSLFIQEGVYTLDSTAAMHIAEPVIYMAGHHVIGGFYRSHPDRGASRNLNAPGAQFTPINFSKIDPTKDTDFDDRWYAYGVIARLAMLAAAKESAAIKVGEPQ